MDMDRLLSQMIEDAARVGALVQGVSDQQARWKPDPDSWSILEVLNHLLDEEREDFRVRLDYTLHRPGEPWPPIDPGRLGDGTGVQPAGSCCIAGPISV